MLFTALKSYNILHLHKCLSTRFFKHKSYIIFTNFCTAAHINATPENSSNDSPNSVDAIIDQICKLNVLEMASFSEKLKIRLKIPDSAFAASSTAAIPVERAIASEVKKEETPESDKNKSYTVKLAGFESADKIKVIKVVRSLFGLGLKEVSNIWITLKLKIYYHNRYYIKTLYKFIIYDKSRKI